MQLVRSIRALALAEKSYLDRGYDPEESVKIVYERAVSFYDSVFPDDEPKFRDMLLKRYERQLFKARRVSSAERRKRPKIQRTEVFIDPEDR